MVPPQEPCLAKLRGSTELGESIMSRADAGYIELYFGVRLNREKVLVNVARTDHLFTLMV